MKKIFLFVFTLILFNLAFSQNVNIPDANFKAILIGNSSINTNNDAHIQVSEANAYNGTISCSNAAISDLTGIEAFTSLTALYCHSNSLSNLNLSQNIALEVLYCGANQITSLDLSQNASLNVLYNNFNPVGSLDLSQNILLEHVFLEDNGLDSLDISQNLALVSLSCSSNLLDSLDLSQNSLLVNLIASDNQIDKIDLSQNPKLEVIQLDGNSLDSIDVRLNPLLEELYVFDNNLSALDITQNPVLFNLNASNNNISSSLDISQNPDLIVLNLENNGNINVLDVHQNTLLKLIDCSNNAIVDLDISQNPDLLFFNCSNNNLLTLNAANGANTSLSSANFNCSDNPNLFCIEVDDTAYANANFVHKDTAAFYSLDCNYCLPSSFVQNITICSMDTFVSPNSNSYSTTGTYHDTLVNACGRDSVIRINLLVDAGDSTYLGVEEFCEGTNVVFYGDTIFNSGIYYQILSNQNSCDSVLSKTFTEIFFSPSVVANNGVLEADSGLSSYQWFQDSAILANDTLSTFTPTTNGTYYCLVSNGLCQESSNIIQIDVSTIIHQNFTEKFKVFPNPTEGILLIESAENTSSFSILNLKGETLKVINPQTKKIDVSDLAKGVYFLKLHNAIKDSFVQFSIK